MTTTGYKNLAGVDIGTLFEPYVSGSHADVSGYLDLSGNDLNTRLAPYVSGSQSATTGYKNTLGFDLNTVFAPPAPAFPTLQSSVYSLGYSLGTYVHAYLDDTNMVMCCQGGTPSGDTYTYLYWSNDYGSTLNRATVNGSTVKFFGCVAISGANAVAMGRLSSGAGVASGFYLSSDYGKTYVSASSGAAGTSGGGIAMSGAVAFRWLYNQPVYRSTDYGNNWVSVAAGSGAVGSVKMYGNNVYVCSSGGGFYYSTNAGLTFTKSTNIPAPINCVTMVGTTLYIGGSNVIYKSTDNGVTATVVLSSASARNVASITSCPATNGDFVWFGNDDTNINYYSNNSGINWTTIASGVPKPFLSWATPTRMITGVGSGVTTGGFYWGRNAYIK